ncbi:MAG: hypothetical protein ICV64_12390 [Thermoleophilia bacterium]|nr:hypothetical protein [Thermoleophilia bacterium]
MSRRPAQSRPRSGRARRGGVAALARAAVLAVLAALLFAVGLSLGRATRESPAPGQRTLVRTLHPATVAPPRRTVTVTVTAEG